MKRFTLLPLIVSALLVIATADSAWALHGAGSCGNSCGASCGHSCGGLLHGNQQDYSWHGGYYHSAWGMPVALVVPPTAEFQSHWGWGVGNTRTTVIRPQFGRNYPGPGVYDRGMFRPTPPWPSDTDQFGVYYVRGPW